MRLRPCRARQRTLAIFHHLPKTAGRSLQAVVRRNYAEHELAQLYGVPRSHRWHALWWRSLSAAEQASLRCVAGHSANMLAPALDRPWTAFAIVRHPLDRVPSLWAFFRGRAERRRDRLRIAAGERGMPELLEATGWTIDDVYRQGASAQALPGGRELLDGFCDQQARMLAAGYPDLQLPAPGRISPAAAAPVFDELVERLDRDYRIGTYGRLPESLVTFADCFGWRHTDLPHRNVTQSRPSVEELAPATRELILSHNQLDLALYERFAVTDPGVTDRGDRGARRRSRNAPAAGRGGPRGASA